MFIFDHISHTNDVDEVKVEDLNGSDDDGGFAREESPPPLQKKNKLRRQAGGTFDLSGVQENMIKELTHARQMLSMQQEQAMSRVETTCVESITKMETTIMKLRLEKVRLEEQVKASEEMRMANVRHSANFLHQGPRRTAQVPLPFTECTVAEPHLTAPKMDLLQLPKMDRSRATTTGGEREDEVEGMLHASSGSKTQTAWLQRSNTKSRQSQWEGTQLERAKVAEAKAGRGGKIFVDASSMKEKVKEAVMKPEYNVFDYYKEEGPWQRIARSNLFENITLVIVFINAIWIWIDTDYNQATSLLVAHPIFIFAENFFCSYFSAELFIRFMAFSKKKFCFTDAWFNFDSVLVLLMVVETWVMTVIVGLVPELVNANAGGGAHQLVRLVRLMRLTRMARMVRLLRAIPELMVLCKSVVVAIRSVIFTLCLLVVFIYIFALIFVQLDQSTMLGDAFSGDLRNVPDAMMFLLLRGILPDLAEHVYTFGSASPLGSVVFLAFILVASLTIMNMLMGVLVQVIGVVSDVERERMTVQWVKVKLLEMMESLDDDGNMQISKNEFQRLLLNPKAAKMVQEVGVDVVNLVDFADFIFENDRELTFAEFMELVLQLRGTNIATVKDIVDLRKFISVELQHKLAAQLGQGLKVLSQELRAESSKALANSYMVNNNKLSVANSTLPAAGDEV